MYQIVITAMMTAATHSMTVTDTITICLVVGPSFLSKLFCESPMGATLGSGLRVVLVLGVVGSVVVVHVITEIFGGKLSSASTHKESRATLACLYRNSGQVLHDTTHIC